MPYTSPPPVVSSVSGQYSSAGGTVKSNTGAPTRNVDPSSFAVNRKETGAPAQDKKKKKKSGKDKALLKWLAGDSTYQQQSSALTKELEDYKVSNKNQRMNVREDFRVANDRLGQERERALEQMLADFAARGLHTSGLFVDSRGDYEKDVQDKLGDLTRDRTRSIEALIEQLGMYRRSNKNSLEAAKQDAIRRRAEQLGLGF